MDKISASIEEEDDQYFLRIDVENGQVSIPISVDDPNEVKSAFNSLILRLKDGLFEIEMAEIGTSLFDQVAAEYISQLNRELKEVHSELDEHGLLAD